MILVRSPLRITLGGGGSDLPSYASRFGGLCLTASIDKYVFVAVTRPFEPGIYLKYSQLEKVARVEDVQHPIIREALRLLHPEPQIEITTLADIPAGTGLGSSSSFTTAILAALALHHGERLDPGALAAMAGDLEIDRLHQPIGTQDQFAAAYGGLLAQQNVPGGPVKIERIRLAPADRAYLEDHLLLFFTGYTRESVNEMLTAQAEHLDDLHDAKATAQCARKALTLADWPLLAMTIGARRSKPIPWAAMWAIEAGEATGASGKLVGAGGGGFLLFHAEHVTALRQAMAECGLPEVRFRFDTLGTTSCL
jgi:D-glycero-alpha-D-manno-heptose-7-phosphate kinase